MRKIMIVASVFVATFVFSQETMSRYHVMTIPQANAIKPDTDSAIQVTGIVTAIDHSTEKTDIAMALCDESGFKHYTHSHCIITRMPMHVTIRTPKRGERITVRGKYKQLQNNSYWEVYPIQNLETINEAKKVVFDN